MAAQNFFEKYGIKEVADVTFYRIEKKEETFEATRKFSVASVLKGAIELQDVYPFTDFGVGDEVGFKAYVFKDADIIRNINYDCDDAIIVKEVYKVKFDTSQKEEELDRATALGYTKLNEYYKKSQNGESITDEEHSDEVKNIIVNKTIYNTQTGLTIAMDEEGNPIGYKQDTTGTNTTSKPVLTKIKSYVEVDDEDEAKTYTTYFATYTVKTAYKNEVDAGYGAWETNGSYDSKHQQPDLDKNPGTHEFSYEEQVCMLFAKKQNLIDKTGVRYQFKDANNMFEDIVFDDSFTIAPNSTEKIVVVGINGSMTAGTYNAEEVMKRINSINTMYSAKAYNVNYSDYAELVVEDEMGYYNPAYLGKDYVRDNKSGKITHFTDNNTYQTYAKSGNGVDQAIKLAKMWDDGEHYSINDAIDALKQKKKTLDASEPSDSKGIKSIFGGYNVSSKCTPDDPYPAAGTSDTDEKNNMYQYSIDNETDKKTLSTESNYTLKEVSDAVKEIGLTGEVVDQDLRVDIKNDGKSSNRAIYVRVGNLVDTAAGAFIYLLHNKNFKNLRGDEDGIFSFEDKKGNTLYYQDKIYAGIEWLALVILGDKGIIFVVNRHGNRVNDQIAWMVNENGYITNDQAEILIENGLIHTIDVTTNDETFEATCTVCGMKIHKTKKKTNHYIPVLFLDTLKISTIEQTAEEVYATGGHGNANLIGWDYGKQITLSLQDALFTPASMSAIFGSYEGNDFTKGIKEVKDIDRFRKVTAKRSFIVPAGNSNGTPTEADRTAQAVYYDPATMKPYQDGTPIAEGEVFYKYTREVAYEGQSLGHMIEISADKFPGTYKVVGDTYVRSKDTGEDERFQFVIPQAKMTSEQTITLEADGEPSVFDMNLTVLRPDDGVMVRFIQYNVVDNEEQNDGSDMVKGTENLNLLDDAELFKVSADGIDEENAIGATEY